jgi:hypothetical protein
MTLTEKRRAGFYGRKVKPKGARRIHTLAHTRAAIIGQVRRQERERLLEILMIAEDAGHLTADQVDELAGLLEKGP